MSDSNLPTMEQVLFELLSARDVSPVVLHRHSLEPEPGFEEFREAIEDRLRRGDILAWCELAMTAHFGEFSGVAIVRGVTTGSLEEFVDEDNVHYVDLRAAAFGRLIENIALKQPAFIIQPRSTAGWPDEIPSRNQSR